MPRERAIIAEIERLEQERQRRASAGDPVAFARSLTLVVNGETVPFRPDPWQVAVLRHEGDRLILNVGRQAGKSTVLAILALHRALYVPGSLILIVSGSQRQSDELFRKVLDFLSRLPVKPKLSEDNKRSIELENRSRIVALPSNDGTIRGFSGPAILIEDEAAEVPDEVHVAIRPMLLRSKGKFIMSGTPKGRRGHFFETWSHESPESEWRKIRLRSEDSSCDKSWLAREKADLASRGLEAIYRQEYECEFIDGVQGRVYSGFDEERSVSNFPASDPSNPWIYVLGLDFGIVDRNALSVLAWRRYDSAVYVLLSYKLKGDALNVADEVKSLDAKYKFSKIVGDVGGMGKGFQAIMRGRASIPVEAAEKHNKAGYISFLNGALRERRLKIVLPGSAELRDEWLSLAWADSGTKEASGENHCADATLYAWRATNADHERPKVAAAKYGTPEYWAEREKEEIAREIEESRRRKDEDWITTMERDGYGF